MVDTKVDAEFCGDTVILVQDTLFHIPTYLLAQESQLFSTLFTLSPAQDTAVEGASGEHPLDLSKADPSVTKEDFKLFARALSSTVYAPVTLSREELKIVLHLAHKWDFDSLRQYALRNLGIDIDPVTRRSTVEPWELIALGARYGSDQLLITGYVNQCCSITPPDRQVLQTVVSEIGPDKFLDLLEARRQVWKYLRRDHPRRTDQFQAFVQCYNKPDYCHTHDMFKQAWELVMEEEALPRDQNAGFKAFEDTFEERFVFKKEQCANCRSPKVLRQRLGWYIDSPEVWATVRAVMNMPKRETAAS